MPPTRSSKSKSKSAPNKDAAPAKRTRQRNGQQDNEGNTLMSNDTTETGGTAAGATGRKSRKHIVAPMIHSNGNDNDKPATSSSKQQDSAQPAQDMNDITDEIPAKRLREESDNAVEEAGPVKKVRGRPPLKRDPLPDRKARNTCPAGQPTPRRTSQQVAADREVEKRALEESIRAGELAKQQYARMHLAEEQLDNNMAVRNPQRLSVAIRMHHFEDEGESFDFEGLSSPSEPEVIEWPTETKKVRMK